MSAATRSPMRVLGGTNQSGFINDGIQQWTQGGQNSYTAFSGVGAAALIASGPGRLNSILVISQLQSGRGVLFVDSAVATSGMPFSTSGHNIVGFIPDYMLPVGSVTSGNSQFLNPNAIPGAAQVLGFSFQSGLVAAPLASGTCSFSVNWTPSKPNLSGGFFGGVNPSV